MYRSQNLREIKNALRKTFSSRRAAIPDEEHRLYSNSICDAFMSTEEYKKADAVLLYVSINREVRTKNLIDKILADKKRVALPVCFENGIMEFRYIKSKKDLTRGLFSAPEPNKNCELFTGAQNAVCVIPALSFDVEGYRLGYGKGYYDRYLSGFNVFRVGFCFDALFEENLPRGKFDKKVDMVITEKGVWYTDEKK